MHVLFDGADKPGNWSSSSNRVQSEPPTTMAVVLDQQLKDRHLAFSSFRYGNDTEEKCQESKLDGKNIWWTPESKPLHISFPIQTHAM